MPVRFAPCFFGFILSGLMSGVVCVVATLRNAGRVQDLVGLWLIAFPVLLIVTPLTRRPVGVLVGFKVRS